MNLVSRKKQILIILIISVAVIIISALFVINVLKRKNNEITEATNLQDYIGDGYVVDSTAFTKEQLFLLLYSTDNDKEQAENNYLFDNQKFTLFSYDIFKSEAKRIPIDFPTQRTIIKEENGIFLRCCSLYESISVTQNYIVLSFTEINYFHNEKNEVSNIAYCEPKIYLYSLDGDYVKSLSLSDSINPDAVMIPKQDLMVADDNYIYAICSSYPNFSSKDRTRENTGISQEDSKDYLVIYDYNGKIINLKEAKEDAEIIKSFGKGIILKNDGRLNYVNGEEFFSINSISNCDYVIQSNDSAFDFLYGKRNVIYGYNINNNKSKKIFKSDDTLKGFILARNKTASAGYYLDGILYCPVNYGYPNPQETLFSLKKGGKKENSYESRLIIATINPYFTTGRLANIFTSKYPDYIVEVREYDNQEKLFEAIGKNEQIDLIDLSNINIDSLIDKNILVDYYEYINKDDDLNKTDFLENVVEVFEINGHLYEAFPGYYPVTVLSPDCDNWGYSSIIELSEKNPTKFSREEILLYSYFYYKEKLIKSTSNGTEKKSYYCDFSYPEFAEAFKKTINYPGIAELYGDSDEAIDLVRVLEERGMIETSLSIYDLAFLSYYNQNHNKISIKGYPLNNGNASFYGEAIQIGMINNSNQKDLSWEFIKPYFTLDYQVTECYRNGFFPTRKDALMILNDAICLKEEKEVEILGTIPAYSSNKAFDYIYENVKWEGANIEEIQRMEKELIPAIVYPKQDMIQTIILEEAEAYWQGGKNPEDCLDAIQKRVSIYINE